MSWTDEEIDKLFQESAKELSFKYDNAYFKEFEAAALPIKTKGKDFLWMGTALVFIGVLTTGYFFTNRSESPVNETEGQFVAAVGAENSTSTKTQKAPDDQANSETGVPTAANETRAEWSQVTSKMKSTKQTLSSSTSPRERNAGQGGNPSTSFVSGNPSTTERSARELISAGSSELPNSIQLLNDGSTQEVAENNGIQDASIAWDFAQLVPNKANGIENAIEQEIGTINMPPLGQITPKTAFYLEATAGVSQSLITPSANFSNSYGGGFGLETHFGQFSLNTGLNFNVSNHQDLELTRSWKIYSFGSTSGMDSYDYKNVYALEMPISMGYNFGKHRLALGVRPSVVIGAKIDHQTFEDDNLTRSERIYGLAGGLQRFGFKPMIGYSFHMQQKWTIGLNVGVQLLEAVNEEYINGFNNPYPIDGQIYLRRTLR